VRSREHVGVDTARNEVDMSYRLEIWDMHADSMATVLLRAGARCFTRGPYGAAGGWRKVRRMARRDAGQFSAGTGMCRRKTP